jgi:hypothetical protein
LRNWWRDHDRTGDLQQRAEDALSTAKAQRPQVEQVVNFVDRMSRNLGRSS